METMTKAASCIAALTLIAAFAIPISATASCAKAKPRTAFSRVADIDGAPYYERDRIERERAEAERIAAEEEAARIAAEQDEAEAAAQQEAEWYAEPSYAYYGAYSGSTATTTEALLNGQGRAWDNGTSYTWYPHDIGNGPLDVPGETFDESGVSHDGDGYIVVASDDYAKGTVIDTPYGEAKVYDKGSGHGNIDLYTGR